MADGDYVFVIDNKKFIHQELPGWTLGSSPIHSCILFKIFCNCRPVSFWFLFSMVDIDLLLRSHHGRIESNWHSISCLNLVSIYERILQIHIRFWLLINLNYLLCCSGLFDCFSSCCCCLSLIIRTIFVYIIVMIPSLFCWFRLFLLCQSLGTCPKTFPKTFNLGSYFLGLLIDFILNMICFGGIFNNFFLQFVFLCWFRGYN